MSHILVGARPRTVATTLATMLMAAALVQAASYSPGIMTWDAINQYGQAVQGVFDDWHPPVMAWLWRRLIPIKAGPAPMYGLQLVLYWTGYGLIAGAALRRGQFIAAAIVAVCALMPFPLAIMGSVLKDCLMQGLLLSAVGLFLWNGYERGVAFRLVAVLLLLLAGLLRFNGFLATFPLVIALLPQACRRTRLRFATVVTVVLAALLVAMPAANRLIGADRSHVELSLVIFDLGGITQRTGVDVFPRLDVKDPVAVNARCYSKEKWDRYSSWGKPPCAINFERIDQAMGDSGAKPFPTLARAVLAHPIAYAGHRLAHFNIATRFLVHDEVQGAAPDRAVDNEWHFTVASNIGLRSISRLAEWSIHSPLGWPIFWLALAGGLLGLCPCLPSRSLIAPVALSALLYGLGYLLFGVSSELRYHLWTITGTAIAAAFALDDLAAGTAISRRRVATSLLPPVCVALLCALWRLS